MKKTSIRRKLLSALMLPILAVAVFAGFGVRDANEREREVDSETRLALAAGGPSTLITALMDERNVSAIELIGLETVVTLRVASSTEARADTDAFIETFRQFLDESSTEVQEIYGPALDAAVADIDLVRDSVDRFEGPRTTSNLFANEVFSGYSTVVGRFHEANDVGISKISDAELRNRARAVADLSQISDSQAQLARYAALAQLRPGGATIEDTLQAAEVNGLFEYVSARSVNMLAGDPPAQSTVTGFLGRDNQVQFSEMIDRFLVTGQADPAAVVAAAGDDSSPNASDAWVAARRSINDRAQVMHSGVDSGRVNSVAVLLGTAAVTVLVALFSARSLSRPLHDLARQADDMAAVRLPDAVASVLATPNGADIEIPEMDAVLSSNISEVAKVAEALNSVQDRTLTLAVEQAGLRHNVSDSLTHLGRRIQLLVGRQLQYLTDLEENQTDPEALDELYRLDHLATRMRRNAESLVVLAGGDDRRSTYGPPMLVADAVRSATSEVESYQRVQTEVADRVLVAGSVANELAHILAELIENGLSFSPPDSNVVVSGGEHDAGYEIRVTDAGIGMTPEAMRAANVRLAGEESFTVSPSKYLGHYVAGQLANRSGIQIRLSSSKIGGVVAQVFLPKQLIVEDNGSDTGPVESPLVDTPDGVVRVDGRPPTLAEVLEASRAAHSELSFRASV